MCADLNHVEILRSGPAAWNVWREKNPSTVPDLAGIALSLGERQVRPSNGRPINLKSARLQDTTFHFATLVAADLEAASMSRADLLHARLRQANLAAANLSHARLDYSDLSEANLTQANLRGASLRFATLSNANLEAACFSGADLAYAQFGHANLGSANLSGARLEVWRSRDAGDCLHQKRIGRPLRQGLPLTRTSGRSWHKAEVSCLRVIRPLYGTERTIDFAMPMSANDPKRTFPMVLDRQ